jgi:hypothetical protein
MEVRLACVPDEWNVEKYWPNVVVEEVVIQFISSFSIGRVSFFYNEHQMCNPFRHLAAC